MNKYEKYQKLYLTLCHLWKDQNERNDEEEQKLLEQINEEFFKKDKNLERFQLELHNPELFQNQLTPKEFGIKKLKRHETRKH